MRDMMPAATPPCCVGVQMIHCGSASSAQPQSFRGSLTLNQSRLMCAGPHHQPFRVQYYSRAAHAQQRVTCAAAVRSSAPAQQRQQGGPTDAIPTPSDRREGILALKEWAVTCAALATGQQTVSTRVSVGQRAMQGASNWHIVTDDSATSRCRMPGGAAKGWHQGTSVRATGVSVPAVSDVIPLRRRPGQASRR
jgi:hypothetical protein